MHWPAHIVAKSSHLLDTETIENKFYGLYDSILNESFPSTHFMITPQYVTAKAPAGGTGAMDFMITYVIEPLDLDSPIFFIKIRPPTHLPSISACKDAKNQVRTRFVQLAHLIQIPKLYGVSAIGRQLSYYTYERASSTVEPVALVDSTAFVVDTAPIGRWNMNIMQEEGRAKFLAIVEEIKQMVQDLWYRSMYSVVQPPSHHSRGVVIHFVPELVCGIAVVSIIDGEGRYISQKLGLNQCITQSSFLSNFM